MKKTESKKALTQIDLESLQEVTGGCGLCNGPMAQVDPRKQRQQQRPIAL